MPVSGRAGSSPIPSTSSTSVSVPMIPSPIARPTSNDNTLFCADAMSRAYASSVRYHWCTVTPPSTIANASLFVTARNSSSSSNSADAHGASGGTVGGEADVEGGAEGEGAVDEPVVESVVEDWVRSARHPMSSPPSAAPPAARRTARREYMTDDYRREVRNACDRSHDRPTRFTHSSAAEVVPLGFVRRQLRAPTWRSRCPLP